MGLNARPKPSPVRLTLKQRRALSICEYYSARMARGAIVPGHAYYFAFWLEWSQNVRAYVELPSNPDNPEAKLADFWVQTADDESFSTWNLANVRRTSGRLQIRGR